MKRLIICLDVRDGKTTKGIKFKENIDVGDPVEMAAKYYDDGVDELVFYDITASHERRSAIIPVVEGVARKVFIPFTVGGGISSVDEMRNILHAGADKISVNSQAVKNPALIEEGAALFGNQCIVLGMDAAADPSMPSGYRVFINGGRTPTEFDALAWALRAESLGAGEIVLNSVDADGTKEGYESCLTRLISSAVNVPVVASGGAGKPAHLAEVLTAGKADAALVASIVHYNEYSVQEIKEYLKAHNIPVRI
ncbi:MAG: imidazole glycerol phosphate synthase subunit HisF [Deferribacteraceae bacterium]|jgi:cyclase|nr:imidazole glycerol phosphate synthase subunit HisF [Deferribacteraceae bacterium]